MTQSSSQLNIEGLSLTERMLLVERIWASIMSDQGSLEITDSQREELDRRLEAYEASQERGSPWESIKGRLQIGE